MHTSTRPRPSIATGVGTSTGVTTQAYVPAHVHAHVASQVQAQVQYTYKYICTKSTIVEVPVKAQVRWPWEGQVLGAAIEPPALALVLSIVSICVVRPDIYRCTPSSILYRTCTCIFYTRIFC